VGAGAMFEGNSEKNVAAYVRAGEAGKGPSGYEVWARFDGECLTSRNRHLSGAWEYERRGNRGTWDSCVEGKTRASTKEGPQGSRLRRAWTVDHEKARSKGSEKGVTIKPAIL